jgi:hypothetical protein
MLDGEASESGEDDEYIDGDQDDNLSDNDDYDNDSYEGHVCDSECGWCGYDSGEMDF